MFNVTANGTVNIVDSLLTANTAYQIMVMANMDQLPSIMNSAVSVSDYITAQAEFVSQNLDRTYKNTSIITGMGYWAVDVNRSNGFDGGDLTKLYAQAVGVNQLITYDNSVCFFPLNSTNCILFSPVTTFYHNIF